MNDLETALRELDVEWPATPDLATAVTARLAAEPRAGGRERRVSRAVLAKLGGRASRGRRRGLRARLAYFAAALVLLGGGTLAVSPAARSSVLEWLGLKSVEIKREQRGRRRARARPRHAARRAPPRHPRPEGARPARHGVRHDAARRLEDGLAGLQGPAEGPRPGLPRAGDAVHPEDARPGRRRAERVPNGYWITGAHGFAYQSATGFGYEQQRLADRTLLIERDGLLIRVEGDLTKARALAIAASVH